MKAGRASQTSELVCMGRAVAHALRIEPAFEDPTALVLLPESAQQRVARAVSLVPPKRARARLDRTYLRRNAAIMAARSLAIDADVRSAAAPQVVILGAGLDGRAYRMRELADAVVFEVDHPDTQRDKRARIGELLPRAHQVRFVPVDFSRDALDAALAAAGHDAARATTWIWEGVIMYLTPLEVEKTLSVIARRSVPKSRLVALYHSPALLLRVVGLIVRSLGEPLRSKFTEGEMRRLLEKHGFASVRDRSVADIGADLSEEVAHSTRFARHLRLISADAR